MQNALDASTDEILNCLGDPTDVGAWKRRGLVIGDVQSGKTATYIGAVNKAADAGLQADRSPRRWYRGTAQADPVPSRRGPHRSRFLEER